MSLKNEDPGGIHESEGWEGKKDGKKEREREREKRRENERQTDLKERRRKERRGSQGSGARKQVEVLGLLGEAHGASASLSVSCWFGGWSQLQRSWNAVYD